MFLVLYFIQAYPRVGSLVEKSDQEKGAFEGIQGELEEHGQ